MKLTVTVTKKMTINTGNYSSIQPSYSITASEVDSKDLGKVQNNLNVIAEAEFLQQVKAHLDIMGGFKQIGIKEVIESIDYDQMEEDVRNAVSELTLV